TTPLEGINLVATDSITAWNIVVKGSEGTLYEGQEFELEVVFGSNYPMEAPEVQFVGKVPIHPHIYSNGHICLSILYDHWTPALTEPPPDDARYVRTAPKSSKKSKWSFHDDSV
ncbi:hypothetical protein HDV06_003738, partial [Boothiomyces sp. JEL0866]